MIKKLLILPILLTLILATNTLAENKINEDQLNAISKMGKLNAIALQCKYIEQMQYIKQVLILNLPKKRALGDWFEIATRTAFMDFITSDSTCESHAVFVLQVDDAAKELENAFKK